MSKCKIVYEYIQYDGLNGREVVEFVKQRVMEKDMKFVWEEDKASDTCYAGVKQLRWKCYNPKMISKDSAFECGIFEGQYVVYSKGKKEVRIVPLSIFKSTYEEDEEINTSEILKKISDIPSVPHTPNPWYPGIDPWTPQWNQQPSFPKPSEIWCKTNTGDPLPDVGNITCNNKTSSKVK